MASNVAMRPRGVLRRRHPTPHTLASEPIERMLDPACGGHAPHSACVFTADQAVKEATTNIRVEQSLGSVTRGQQVDIVNVAMTTCLSRVLLERQQDGARQSVSEMPVLRMRRSKEKTHLLPGTAIKSPASPGFRRRSICRRSRVAGIRRGPRVQTPCAAVRHSGA